MPIIAELSQGHNGSVDELMTLTDYAAEAGAWAVKIQTFFADDLADNWRIKDYHRLKNLELDFAAHLKFAKHCKDLGVVPMTSVYSDKYLLELKDVGFEWLKIGSGQALNSELIRACNEKFKVIVSTGGTDLNMIDNHFLPPYAYLHCVSQYPTYPYESNLHRLFQLKNKFPDSKIGLSSHINPTHPKWMLPLQLATIMGFPLIEAHFTIRERYTTKDGPVSLDARQMKDLCGFQKLNPREQIEMNPILGLMVYPQKEEEIALIDQYRGRWK